MKQVFGLREPLGQMSPVHIPRGFTQAYIEGEVVEDLPARIRAAHARLRRSRHPADRGHRSRRRRRGHRALERRRSRRCSGRRPSSSPRAASAGRSTRSCSTPRCSSATASRSPGRSSTRSTSTPSPASPGRSSAGWRATGSRCSASCRTGRSCRTRPSAMVLEGVHGETIHPGPDLDSVIGGDRHRRDGAASTCSSGSGRAAWSSCPATGATSSARSLGAHDAADDDGRRRRSARARADRRLPAAPSRSSTPSARPTCSRRSSPEDTYKVASELHDLLVKTHQSDAGKIAEIKALALGVPVHRPGPRGRGGGPARLDGLDRLRAWNRRPPRRSGAPS